MPGNWGRPPGEPGRRGPESGGGARGLSTAAVARPHLVPGSLYRERNFGGPQAVPALARAAALGAVRPGGGGLGGGGAARRSGPCELSSRRCRRRGRDRQVDVQGFPVQAVAGAEDDDPCASCSSVAASRPWPRRAGKANAEPLSAHDNAAGGLIIASGSGPRLGQGKLVAERDGRIDLGIGQVSHESPSSQEQSVPLLGHDRHGPTNFRPSCLWPRPGLARRQVPAARSWLHRRRTRERGPVRDRRCR
jgi:hypothetical protein